MAGLLPDSVLTRAGTEPGEALLPGPVLRLWQAEGSPCRTETWGRGVGAARAEAHSPPGWPAPSWLWRGRGSWGCGGHCAPRAAHRARRRTRRQKQRDRVSRDAGGTEPPAKRSVSCEVRPARQERGRLAGVRASLGKGGCECHPARSKAFHPSGRRTRHSRLAGRKGPEGSAGLGVAPHGAHGGKGRCRQREPPPGPAQCRAAQQVPAARLCSGKQTKIGARHSQPRPGGGGAGAQACPPL